MSKRNGTGGYSLRRRAVTAALDQLRKGTDKRAATQANTDDFARREFIKRIGVAAAALGLPPSLSAGAASHAVATHAKSPGHRKTKVTLFFNLSHLRHVNTTHHLFMGGRKHELERVDDKPQILRQARHTNAFLRHVGDEHITHHAKNVEIASDMVTLAYLTCNEDATTGTWEMTSMHFNIPPGAFAYAYAQAREFTPDGPLPLSAKRRFYRAPAATTQSDLEDESVLIDFNSHAEALVGLHPDLVSIDPDSAAHIQCNYVSQDSNTQFLAALLQTLGPAAPQGTSASGLTAWATLLPLVDAETGQPIKKSDGKLNQYYPDWSVEVEQNMAQAVSTVHPFVKNDQTLGFDVTGLNLNDPTQPIPPGELKGKKWAVHDGIPTVLRSPDDVSGVAPKVVFTNQSVETGLRIGQPDTQVLADGRVQVTLDNVSNWFLRYLAMWVQFLGPDGSVVPASEIPSDTFSASRERSLDKPDDVLFFLGVVPPAFAVCGIPVEPGAFSPTIKIPKQAQTMRIFYSGLGLSGSVPADPAGIVGVGIGMTVAFNYGVVGLFMAAGASGFSSVFKDAVALGGGALAAAITTLIGGGLNGTSPGRELLNFAMAFLRVLFQKRLTGVLGALVTKIIAALVTAEWIDSIPVAGQIARAAAAAVGGIQLEETSIEVALSPPVYTFEVVQTHDFSIRILPDPTDTQFPATPPGFTLYYRVSYLFDNGTAHTLDAVTVPDPTVSILSTFTGIPRGGQVNISVGFYMRANGTPPGQNDWCAGFGTTGLVDNSVDTAPPLTITEEKIPIQPGTQYLHTRKTVLDASGNHLWTPTATAPPYVPPPDGQEPGLGDFNGITVRQGTSTQQGYVGYAWKAFSSGVNGCAGPAPGQFDQMANLNTDDGPNAQNGYVNTAALCGYQPGVRISYNLLTHDALNMYVDTESLMIRQVTLAPPGFAGPGSNQSFGRLNMDSTRCALHPAGHIVSISNANHKLEVLKIPKTPIKDADAAQFLVARTLSGPGLLAGLVMSPVAMAIAPDGAILVLEQGNNRIQAFDLGGNAVSFFKQQADPHFLELDATAGATYLDLAVEFSGYLYVLSKDANNLHRLDIYHSSQAGTAPICTTHDMNAAKLTVDFWRHVYTLNYEVLRLPPPSGAIPDFTEPSVSLWVAPPPAT